MTENLQKKLLKVCYSGDLFKIEELINEGADPNLSYDGSYPIHSALCNGQLHAIDFLIKKGADINLPEIMIYTAMDSEINNYEFNIYELQNKNVTEPSDIYTKFLVENRVNINQLNYWGQTPLDYAIENNHKKAEKLLKEKGAKTSKELLDKKY